ncbi:alpha/beta hydrolase [Porifericola rhodea]|uniref:carboxylesterase family protein n=1 Tax=Porifericola rhodea TaxID=930972 RepID=UPI002666AF04|nr:alpha/beta hydrolase [Porifericola rhodea]WKN31649.1 alpha/beta hydrolase [Porifericola rhodea]
MMQNLSFKNYLTCLLLLLSCTLNAQDRQGNIVEYFGKEKVEEIREGEVVHIFTDGLLLNRRTFGLNSNTTPKEPVFAKFLLENVSKVKEGDAFVEDIFGETSSWEKITTTEKNEFENNGLRSGYLYLEYESEEEKDVIFEASGHTMSLINGFPHEGDHYDFGWSLIPVKLKKGKNVFVLEGGRFGRMRARLLNPHQRIAFTTRDLTLPDVLTEENKTLWGAIRVMNINSEAFTKGSISCKIGDETITTNIASVSPMNIRKFPFQIKVPDNLEGETVKAELSLKDRRGKVLAQETLELAVKSKYDHHKRTFISGVDGSVQYYSVAPSSDKNIENPALFFSVHGASVEAVNQARAYQKKDWGHLVAPTNRRPFGFAWEDWGRLDALEVLADAEELFQTDPQRTYLTGHSMGGHGTWYLGATYPDRWAAIAPCAGYPDLLEYRDSFSRRMENMSDERLARFGLSREKLEKMKTASELTEESDILMDSVLRRAGNPSRTLKLKRNYLHYGVYVLHGEDDTVVPTFIARDMRETLAEFHPDFAYYEYPNGSHWYGNHSVDWPPLFDFFKFRTIKPAQEINEIEFSTASPAVSSGSHFIKILQQESPYAISTFTFTRDSISQITTENAQTLAIDLQKMGNTSNSIMLDSQQIDISGNANILYLTKQNGQWANTSQPSAKEKGPHRDGGFKNAFKNKMVLVYATKGSKEENEWYYKRALFDAEKFWYRANGNVEIIKDTDFSSEKYADQNVIVYGNLDNHAAWKKLLSDSPIQVSDGKLKMGDKTLEGEQWGAYFTYPRADSETASIGVVTASGTEGMKAAYANHYLVNGTTFPDVMIFDKSVVEEGLQGIECAGFFGNDWSVDKGEFVWRK